jgi:CRP-like cAMP-binding protein
MDNPLLGLHLFKGLDPERVSELLPACKTIQLAAGERLFRQGDPGEEVYIVSEGQVRIACQVFLDDDRTLAMLGPGTLFGEAAVIDQEQRSASAVAETDVTLLELSADPMRDWLLRNPDLGVKVLGRLGAVLMARLRDMNGMFRETVQWGMEISGAAKLGLDHLVGQALDVQVELLSGKTIEGRVVRVDDLERGLELWLSNPRTGAHLVPWHAVASIRMAGGKEA